MEFVTPTPAVDAVRSLWAAPSQGALRALSDALGRREGDAWLLEFLQAGGLEVRFGGGRAGAGLWEGPGRGKSLGGMQVGVRLRLQAGGAASEGKGEAGAGPGPGLQLGGLDVGLEVRREGLHLRDGAGLKVILSGTGGEVGAGVWVR